MWRAKRTMTYRPHPRKVSFTVRRSSRGRRSNRTSFVIPSRAGNCGFTELSPMTRQVACAHFQEADKNVHEEKMVDTDWAGNGGLCDDGGDFMFRLVLWLGQCGGGRLVAGL